MSTSITLEERLQQLCMRVEGHMIWCGTSDPDGYGQLWLNGKRSLAHHAAWELAYGPIPTGTLVLHLCPGEPPPCIEPEHLYLGTLSGNIQKRRISA